MSSPIELIREGIVESDWVKVGNGFAALTGERLTVPSPKVAKNLAEDVLDRIGDMLNDYFNPIRDEGDCTQEEEEEPLVPETITTSESPAKMAWEEDVEEPSPAPPRSETDSYDKFRVNHGTPKREDGKHACRVEPFQPGMVNNFRDDRKLATADIADSQKFSQTKEPEPGRPPVKKIKVVCGRCQKTEEVDPLFSPRQLGDSSKGERDETLHVCNDCIVRNIHRR